MENKEEPVKKKKNIIRVYHAQNASEPAKRRRPLPPDGKRPVRPGMEKRRPLPPDGKRPVSPRPVSQNDEKTAGEAAALEKTASPRVQRTEGPVNVKAAETAAKTIPEAKKAETIRTPESTASNMAENARKAAGIQPETVLKKPEAVQPAEALKKPETGKAPGTVKEPEAVKVPETVKAQETVKTTEPAKKIETVIPETSAKAEPAKAEPAKAEPVKTEAPLKKAESVKPAEPARKAEEVKTAEPARKAEAIKPAESPKKAEAPKSAEIPKKAESVKPAESPKKTEAVKTPEKPAAPSSQAPRAGQSQYGQRTFGQGSGQRTGSFDRNQGQKRPERTDRPGSERSDRRDFQRPQQGGTGQGGQQRTGDYQNRGRRFSSEGGENRGGARPPQDQNRRFGQGRPGTQAGGRPEGRPGDRDFRGPREDNGNRPGRDGSRFAGQGQKPSARKGGADFAGDLAKAQKDSRRDRDRDNKNKKRDFENENGNESRDSRKGRAGGHGKNFETGKNFQKNVPAPKAEPKKPEVKEITIPEKLTVRELADAMKVQPSVIVKKLFLQGTMVTVNQEIDFETAQEIALEYDIIAEKEVQVNVIEELLKEDEENEENMVPRPPVVCVMGHVDHGKTSLLDSIRKTNVTRGEAGGITQHIGASVVEINGEKITFLDTPGHEAFTAMRMRGANSTDIAVLVVAADDGVMPQTVEAISHAKAAGVEVIVAINKIDKPSANIERVKQELSEYDLIPEDWGGKTIFVPVSAKTGEGIDNLLEMILLTAEVLELKANPNRAARGLVIEAKLDKGKGPVATILVQKGTLHVGDFIAAGACSGKVRAMVDDRGRRVKEAGPSAPVEIQGLSDVPNAGEVLMSFDSDKEAKNFAGAFVSENKNRLLEETKGKLSLDNLFDQIHASDLKELPIVVKADVQGSVEAVKQSLLKLSNDEVVVKVVHGGVGTINESDVSLASTTNAIIIGFNVRPDSTAKQLAEQEKVDMRLYKVIYQAIEDVEAAMKGMLDPVYEEKVIGHAEVRQLFRASGIGTIAGSYVTDGIIQRGCKVRITRDGEQIFEGSLASLKRFKDDVKEVKTGYECGLVFDGFNDVKEEDRVEAYVMTEVPR